MRALLRLLPVLLAALIASSAPAHACGTAEDVCSVEGGTYRLILPEGPGPHPALFYLHGWGASSEGTMRGRSAMIGTATERGYAIIVPEGIPRAGRTQRDWAVRDGGRHPRDDLAFFEAVLGDAARRGVDGDRVLMAGFSRGGSMVWYAACARPALVRAFAPVAGAFWNPMPKGCADPGERGLALHHTHGWTDRVVPLEGRLIGGGRLVQGDVFASLTTLRETLGCTLRLADETRVEGAEWQRDWTSCRQGRIALRLHPGGHTVPEGWTTAALDWFETVLNQGTTVAR
ncbi:MAG: polyhydroxybutyrate depolymerase [Pseudomonadota bacterium]